MKISEFKEQTKVLQKPGDMTDDECLPLPIYCNNEVCISLWKGNLIERIKFLFTGKVWLQVRSGMTQPAVCVDLKFPFIKKNIRLEYYKAMLRLEWDIFKSKIRRQCEIIRNSI